MRKIRPLESHSLGALGYPQAIGLKATSTLFQDESKFSMTRSRTALSLISLTLVAALGGCGGGGSTTTATATTTATTTGTGTNILIVSGVTPATGNGNFPLPLTSETAAGGTSTAKRVEFTDAASATRTLRLYYQPGTGALENIQFESPQKNFNCFVGDPIQPCPVAKITFSASGKSILLDLAEFKSGTTSNGILEGLLKW